MEKERLLCKKDNSVHNCKKRINSIDSQLAFSKPTNESNQAEPIFFEKPKKNSLLSMLVLVDESEDGLNSVPEDNSQPEQTLYKKSVKDILESKYYAMNCSIDEMNKTLLKELMEFSDNEHFEPFLKSRINSLGLQLSYTPESYAQLLKQLYSSLDRAKSLHFKENSNKEPNCFYKISNNNCDAQFEIQKAEQLQLKESQVLKSFIISDKSDVQQKVHSQKQEKKRLTDVINTNKDKIRFDKRIELFKKQDKANNSSQEEQFYQNKRNFKKQEYEYYQSLGKRNSVKEFLEGN